MSLNSCAKEKVEEDVKENENISLKNNQINYWDNQELIDLIGDSYNIDITNATFNNVVQLDNSNDYDLIVFSVLSTNDGNYNNLILRVNITKDRMILFEGSEVEMENITNYRIKPFGFTAEAELSYTINQAGVIDFDDFDPICFGCWWECMEEVYSDYTSDFMGQITWVPAGAGVGAIWCALLPPPVSTINGIN